MSEPGLEDPTKKQSKPGVIPGNSTVSQVTLEAGAATAASTSGNNKSTGSTPINGIRTGTIDILRYNTHAMIYCRRRSHQSIHGSRLRWKDWGKQGNFLHQFEGCREWILWCRLPSKAH